MKPLSANGSVGSPHVRVGHCQASIPNPPYPQGPGDFFWPENPDSDIAQQCAVFLGELAGIVKRMPWGLIAKEQIAVSWDESK